MRPTMAFCNLRKYEVLHSMLLSLYKSYFNSIWIHIYWCYKKNTSSLRMGFTIHKLVENWKTMIQNHWTTNTRIMHDAEGKRNACFFLQQLFCQTVVVHIMFKPSELILHPRFKNSHITKSLIKKLSINKNNNNISVKNTLQTNCPKNINSSPSLKSIKSSPSPNQSTPHISHIERFELANRRSSFPETG